MKCLIIIQRVLAIVVMMAGILLMFSEVDITESILAQVEVTFGGLGLAVVGFGWASLTQLEEDWFVNKFNGR